MNKTDYSFFILNTLSRWEAQQESGSDVHATAQGLVIRDTSAYSYAGKLRTPSLAPVSLALDPCGMMGLLDRNEQALLFFDLLSGKAFWLKSVLFPAPVSVALSRADIYVVFQHRLLCLSRANYQIRWDRELAEEIRIARADDENLYILMPDQAAVFRADRNWELQEIPITDSQGAPYDLNRPVDIASDCKNDLYILDAGTRNILRCQPDGRLLEMIPAAYDPALTPVALTADGEGTIFVCFEGRDEIVRLQKVRRYHGSATYRSKAFDSSVPGCRWHKLVLDRELPPNTHVTCSYYASDELPRPDPPPWSVPVFNPEDALLLNATGRYLWVKLELFSDDLGSESPRLRSLKLVFPRQSYLRYLPATYQEDPASRALLERFLSLFETFLEKTDRTVDLLATLWDAHAAPAEFLSWLSGWVGMLRDENWEEAAWREFLARAVQLYKQRGTRRYLSELIRIYTGETPIIVEPFQLRCGEEDARSDLRHLFGSSPYSFCVLLRPGQVAISENDHDLRETPPKTLRVVKRLIETEKPAHTLGGLQLLQPRIVLGGHSYLELNTYLSAPEFVVGKAVLPFDTSIDDWEQGGQLARHARTGIDTVMT